jgi:uncharacterized membrane protein
VTGAPRARALVVALVLVSVAGAALAHYAIAIGRSPTLGALVALAPLAILVAVLARRSRHRLLGGAAIAAFAVLLWAGWDVLESNFPSVYFLQHVGSNLLLGAMFARTLAANREPLCTRFARLVHGTIPAVVDRYTRQVTLAWSIFFLVMAALSCALYFSGNVAAWSVLANFVTLPAVAAMFAAEYLVRLRVLPGWHGNFLDGVRAFWRHSSSAPSEAPR